MSAAGTALVVSAHSADFVWRAGGAIALHAARGMAVTVICLSYGERGESAKLWRLPGMTLDRVKTDRRKEAEAAAQVLGAADIQFWDLGDYPLTLNQDSLFRLVDVYRALRPAFVLTHSHQDIYNHDHPATTEFTQHARIVAQAHGHNPSEKVLGAPPVFLFEPHQPEQCSWTSPRSGTRNAPRSNAWPARSISGNITSASPCSAAPRRRGIPTRRRSPMARATRRYSRT